jgi:hypothetical protein
MNLNYRPAFYLDPYTLDGDLEKEAGLTPGAKKGLAAMIGTAMLVHGAGQGLSRIQQDKAMASTVKSQQQTNAARAAQGKGPLYQFSTDKPSAKKKESSLNKEAGGTKRWRRAIKAVRQMSNKRYKQIRPDAGLSPLTTQNMPSDEVPGMANLDTLRMKKPVDHSFVGFADRVEPKYDELLARGLAGHEASEDIIHGSANRDFSGSGGGGRDIPESAYLPRHKGHALINAIEGMEDIKGMAHASTPDPLSTPTHVRLGQRRQAEADRQAAQQRRNEEAKAKAEWEKTRWNYPSYTSNT